MPTTRRVLRRAAHVTFDDETRQHLLWGYCLLAGPGAHGCGCGLVDRDGVLREALGRRLWQEHRDELLAEWAREKTDARPWAEIQFGDGAAKQHLPSGGTKLDVEDDAQ